MARLTVTAIRRLTTPGRYSDERTLFLHIGPTGCKSWVQRITIGGRRRDIGLGGWPLVPLALARSRAFANRVAVEAGRDPLAEKRRANVPTFREASAATYEANRPRWRSAKTAENWIAQMEKHAFPIVADLPVTAIGREHVLRVLLPIWNTHPDIARKMRTRIKATMAWAQAHGHIQYNPAGEAVDGALPALPSVKAHYRALPYGEVTAALATVEASGASVAALACFRFMVLTAARSGEVRLATWNEIDIGRREWRIGAARMKMRRDHRVPLSDAALAALETVRPLRDASGLVFPSPVRHGHPLSHVTLNRLLSDHGIAAVPHGFRSRFPGLGRGAYQCPSCRR